MSFHEESYSCTRCNRDFLSPFSRVAVDIVVEDWEDLSEESWQVC